MKRFYIAVVVLILILLNIVLWTRYFKFRSGSAEAFFKDAEILEWTGAIKKIKSDCEPVYKFPNESYILGVLTEGGLKLSKDERFEITLINKYNDEVVNTKDVSIPKCVVIFIDGVDSIRKGELVYKSNTRNTKGFKVSNDPRPK